MSVCLQVVAQQFGENRIHAKTWCCIDQGESQIKCHFETNTYVPGEHAKIISEIDNSHCRLHVQRIEARLLKTINLKSHTGRPYHLVTPVSVIQLPGIGAGEDRTGANALQYQIQLVEQNKGPLQPSTAGQLVNCLYSLQVKVVLDGCTCCSAQPEITVPISIVCPPLQDFGQIQPPQNWNPQQYPTVNITFNERDMYVKLNAEGVSQQIANSVLPPNPYGMNQPVMVQQQQLIIEPAQVQLQIQVQHRSELTEGQELLQGQSVFAESGQFYATLQPDGNFVLYEAHAPFQAGSGNALWSSQSFGKGQGPYRLTLQGDGNLCIYDGLGACTWSNNAYGKGSAPYRLVMQNDRQLVQYDQFRTVVWQAI